MGAWIEICIFPAFRSFRNVAPLVGAWIEIWTCSECWKYEMSLLSWERGLKFLSACFLALSRTSLLSWERGLKSQNVVPHYERDVAPLVGAWIEILRDYDF